MPTAKVDHQILETYKKIFDSFKAVNTNRFPEIRNYLQAYVNQNTNSQDPAKLRKVEAAKTLLKVFADQANLKHIINSYQGDNNAAIEELEHDHAFHDDEGDFPLSEFMHQLMPGHPLKLLESLNQVADETITVLDAEQALNTFLTEDNFAEYEAKDSPIRAAIPIIKTAVDAYKANQMIERTAERKAYNVEDISGTVSAKWDQVKKDNANVLYACYGTENLTLKAANKERDDAFKEVQKIDKEIAETQKKLDEDYEKQSYADEIMNTVAHRVVDLEKEVERERNSVQRGEKRDRAIQDKREFEKALKAISDAQEEFTKKPGENYATLLAKAQADLEEAQRNHQNMVDNTDPSKRIDLLMKQGGVSAAQKNKLTELYNNELAGIREEEKWANVLANVQQFRTAFGDDPEIMKFLIGDGDREADGADALRRKYSSDDPMFKLAANIKGTVHELLGQNDILAYDGKGDLNTYVDNAQKKLVENMDAARKSRTKNSLKAAANGIIRMDKKLGQLKEELNNSGNDAEKMIELNKKIQETMSRRGEYHAKLVEEGFKDEEIIKSVAALAKELAPKTVAKQVKEAKDKIEATEKTVKDYTQKQQDIVSAIETFNKYPELRETKGFKEFERYLTAEKPDPKDIIKDMKVFKPAYETIKPNFELGNSPELRRLEDELSEARIKVHNAEKASQGLKTKEHFNKLIKLKIEKRKAQKKLDKAGDKVHRMEAIVHKTRTDMKDSYDRMYSDLNNMPESNVDSFYQIQAFKEDYSKCMRDDYKANPERMNSPEYKAIMTALKGFGETKQDFRALSDQDIIQKMIALKNASTHYAEEKRGQYFHFKPTPQRKWRLDYADKITEYCKRQLEITPRLLQNKGDQTLKPAMKRNIDNMKVKDPNKGFVEDMDQKTRLKEQEKVLENVTTNQEMKDKYRRKADELERKIEDAMVTIENNVSQYMSDLEKMDDQERKKNEPEYVRRTLFASEYLTGLKNDLRDSFKASSAGIDKHFSEIIKKYNNINEDYNELLNAGFDKIDIKTKFDNFSEKIKLGDLIGKNVEEITDHMEKVKLRDQEKERMKERLAYKKQKEEMEKKNEPKKDKPVKEGPKKEDKKDARKDSGAAKKDTGAAKKGDQKKNDGPAKKA